MPAEGAHIGRGAAYSNLDWLCNARGCCCGADSIIVTVWSRCCERISTGTIVSVACGYVLVQIVCNDHRGARTVGYCNQAVMRSEAAHIGRGAADSNLDRFCNARGCCCGADYIIVTA